MPASAVLAPAASAACRGQRSLEMAVSDDGLLLLTNADGSQVSCDLYPLLARLVDGAWKRHPAGAARRAARYFGVGLSRPEEEKKPCQRQVRSRCFPETTNGGSGVDWGGGPGLFTVYGTWGTASVHLAYSPDAGVTYIDTDGGSFTENTSHSSNTRPARSGRWCRASRPAPASIQNSKARGERMTMRKRLGGLGAAAIVLAALTGSAAAQSRPSNFRSRTRICSRRSRRRSAS